MSTNDIIIPLGYEDVIVPEGQYGKLRFSGSLIDIKATPREVRSSDDAAQMRGYPIAQELTTALCTTKSKKQSPELFLAHVRGDRHIDNPALKAILRETFGQSVQGFERARDEELQKLHCVYGTLNPFSKFLAALPQIVSNDLFEPANLVGTNAGALNRFVQFDRELLRKMPAVITADFSKDRVQTN